MDVAVDVMHDMLEPIFKMQRDYVNIMNLDRYPKETERRMSLLCTTVIHEAIELQALTSWKWWKNPVKFDEDKAKEELIDI